MVYDLIIIGAGPAGMTAAVYAARKKMNTLLVTKDFGGQLMWTMDIENYMGYQFITGPELLAKFEEQVRRFSVNIRYEEAIALAVKKDGNFAVTTTDGQYESKTVILASGKRPRRLDIPGEMELTGRGVSYCATCDGPLYAGKTVAVIGGGSSAVQAAIEVSNVGEKVYLVTRNRYSAEPIILDKMKEATNIVELQGYDTMGIYGEQFVEKLLLQSRTSREEKELAVQGVFVEIGLIPNSEFFEQVTELNKAGEVITDCRMQTKIPGLFAAGDVINGPDKQIVIACGDGAKAALVAYEYLLHK